LKSFLITGAAQGLGRTLTEALIKQQNLSDTVFILLDKDFATLKKLSEHYPPQANLLLMPMDLKGATLADYKTLFESLKSEIHALDYLFLNAAHFDGFTPIDNSHVESWYETLQVNLSANFHLLQTLLPLIHKAKGTIIGITDQQIESHPAYYGAYGVAKAGLEQLLSSLAAENRNTDIKVYNAKLNAFQSKTRSKHFPSEDPNTLPSSKQTAEHLVEIILQNLQSEQIIRL